MSYDIIIKIKDFGNITDDEKDEKTHNTGQL